MYCCYDTMNSKLLLMLLLQLVLLVIAMMSITLCFQQAAASSLKADDNDSTLVYPTFLRDNKAVCLSRNRASYYLDNGSGEGLANWLVVLPGGGWCENFTSCLNYSSGGLSESPDPVAFTGGILSSRKLDNPDFYNWNRVEVRYCDGSSFSGNSTKFHNGTLLHFRGAVIFEAAMKELLQKGMGSATQALLAGESAGGVATMIHCDKFRHLFPNSTRVKCLSDAGYFFPAKRHNYGMQSHFLSIFQGLIRLHRSIKALPTSCTQKLNPALCFFAHNAIEYIKTPMFFVMSQYDYIEISMTTGVSKYYYTSCVKAKNCSSVQIKIMQDLRMELLEVLPKQNTTSPIGFLVLSQLAHAHILEDTWQNRTNSGTPEAIAKQFGDWYFDGKNVQFIQGCSHPYGCNTSYT